MQNLRRKWMEEQYGKRMSLKPPTDALLSHWKFDGTYDDSVGGYNLAPLTGGTKNYATDRKGVSSRAYLHGYFTDYRYCATYDMFNRIIGAKPFTLSMWYYVTTVNGGNGLPVLIANSDGVPYGQTYGNNLNFSLSYTNAGVAKFSWTDQAGNRAITFDRATYMPLNSWHHIVVTTWGSQGQDIKLYIDNVLINTTTLLYDFPNRQSKRLTIGYDARTDNVYSTDPFTGYIDDVRIYGREVTAKEVSNLFNE